MSRKLWAGVAVGATLVVAVVAFLLARDEGDGADPGAVDPTSSALPVVSDATWCSGWQNLVAVQGQYVADPTPESQAAVLAVVTDLQELGVPTSLDPAGYTELTAVLDDVRASVDPSFTPSVAPSEPADVAVEDDEHEDEGHEDESDEHEDHGAEASEAPFGAWLAEYCSV